MDLCKIAIVGVGSVGATTAYALLFKNLPIEILLVDISESRSASELLDLRDAQSFLPHHIPIKVATFVQAAHADIIIISAGARQCPGQERSDLLSTNTNVITDIFAKMGPINSQALIIMVTNPVDPLTLLAQNLSGLERNRVFSSGTFLDTQRLKALLSEKLSVQQSAIDLFVLGEHGPTQFVAWSAGRIANGAIQEYAGLSEQDLVSLCHVTKQCAQEIIYGKGATFYGIATCVATLCEIIILDKKTVLPLSFFQPEWNVSLSMPALLGRNGIEKAVIYDLSPKEKEALELCAQKIESMNC